MASATDLARNILGQGLLLGWGDELEGLVRSKFGDETYEDAVKQIRVENETYSTENPYGALAGEIAGGFIPTVGALALTPFTGGSSTALAAGNIGRLVTMGARKLGPLGTAALVGAGEGAIAGAGTAEEGNRLQGAGLGAVIGGAAGTAVQKGSELVVNALNKRAIQKAARQVPDESAYDPLQDRLLESGVRMDAVKMKGGNWIQDENLFMDLIDENSTAPLDAQQTIVQKLRKYVKNDMGTPQDPVRKQADAEGILHYEPDPYFLTEDSLQSIPEERIFGETVLGRHWEDASDATISINTAQGVVNEGGFTPDKYPWLRKVPPETPVYNPRKMGQGYFSEQLGFDELMKELNVGMDPKNDLGLPDSLRIDPKDVAKMSVPAMVRKVDKIKKWREENAGKIEKDFADKVPSNFENKQFSLDFVDGKGSRWLSIDDTKRPDDSYKNSKVCQAFGNKAGWCTKDEVMAETYGSGENRLEIMVDGDGRPHVQAQISNPYGQGLPDNNIDEIAYDELGLPRNWEEIVIPDQKEAFTKILKEKHPEEFLPDGSFVNKDYELDFSYIYNDYKFAEDFIDFQKDRLKKYADENNYIITTPFKIKRRKKEGLPENFLVEELKPINNNFDNERVRSLIEKDPDYINKIRGDTVKYLNKLNERANSQGVVFDGVSDRQMPLGFVDREIGTDPQGRIEALGLNENDLIDEWQYKFFDENPQLIDENGDYFDSNDEFDFLGNHYDEYLDWLTNKLDGIDGGPKRPENSWEIIDTNSTEDIKTGWNVMMQRMRLTGEQITDSEASKMKNAQTKRFFGGQEFVDHKASWYNYNIAGGREAIEVKKGKPMARGGSVDIDALIADVLGD